MLNFYEILSLFLEDMITYTISAYIYALTYTFTYVNMLKAPQVRASIYHQLLVSCWRKTNI